MTAKELYTMARHLMFDNMSSKNLDEYYLSHINVLISELFHENNNLREHKNKSKLYVIPFVENENDVLEYEDEMLYNVMPKGLAARFFVDEDDRSKYTIYQTDYMNARSMIMPLTFNEGWNV